MTKTFTAATSLAFSLMFLALAQDSPTPSPTNAPSPTATTSPARSVRISFLPPPLEGTVSLGVYDATGKLVRVLHREANLDEFTVGADALMTKWDGKDDNGQDLTPGKYHPRGYLVGNLRVQNIANETQPGTAPTPSIPVQIKLVSNPLIKTERPNVELACGFDETKSLLKTADDLPLYTISRRPNLIRVSLAKNTEKSVDIWQDDGATIEHLRVSNIDQMMAFDCGEIELK